MGEAETRQTDRIGPPVDSIEVAEFESVDQLREWLTNAAPLFA
jgi:hypothetical protein